MASDAIDRLQGLRSGVAVKTPARAVATSNITLSGEQTVDGVALVAGDRVLVTGQTSAVGNGVYDVALDAWTRSLDFDGVSDLTDGTMLLVLEGTSYGATMWRLDAAGTPDEDALTFSSGVWVADGAIGTAELAALCVTTAKLAAEAVTAAKLATDAVETAKIKDASVTLAKIAASVTKQIAIASATHDVSVTGGQTIALGFTPIAAIFIAVIDGTSALSFGAYWNSVTVGVANNHAASANHWLDTLPIFLVTGAGAYAGAGVTLGENSIALTWSKVGAPTGTAKVYAIAIG